MVRLRGPTSGGEAASGRLVSRFVGRSEEFAQFGDALTEDPRSAARIISVAGAPGAGKTRFVEEALARIARVGRPVTTGMLTPLPPSGTSRASCWKTDCRAARSKIGWA